jgi:hypothetical protein
VIPGNLYGGIRILAPGPDEPYFAVAMNGMIVAVTHSYRRDPGVPLGQWGALAPEGAFRAGRNAIEFWEVRGEPARPILIPTGRADEALSYLDLDVGGRPHWNVREDGFWLPSTWGGSYTRWTKGAASLVIPIGAERPAELHVGLRDSGPSGADLRLKANGHVLFDARVPRGWWEQTFPLVDVPMEGGEMKIEIESSTFVPSETLAGSADTRTLGVAVETVMLR